MKGRLQFLHHKPTFPNRESAIDWLEHEMLFNLSKLGGTLDAEPIAVKYADKNGTTQVILAVGRDGEEGESKSAIYHYIDSADIYAKVVDEKVRAMAAETSLSDSINTLRTNATNSATSLFNKIETDIANLDSSKTGTESGVKVTVDELNGKISDVVVSVKTLDTETEITATANEVVSGKGVRDAVDKAKSDLQEQVTANKITSEGKTITVVTAATGTNIEVNVDNATLTKDETTTASRGIISSTLKIKSVTPTDPNVKEEFNLIDKNSTVYGDTIKIYKDSALVRAYLGKMDDVVDPDSGIITPGTTGNTALCLLYTLFNGKYELAKIDIEILISKAQFKDGLTVNSSNEVSVLIAGDSESFLSVGPSGVKISGINLAISGETQRALDAENVLSGAIKTEVTDRKDTDLKLDTLSSATYTMKTNLYADNTNPDSIKHIILTDTLIAASAAGTVPSVDASLLRQIDGKIYASKNSKDMLYKGANLETTIDGLVNASGDAQTRIAALETALASATTRIANLEGQITTLEGQLSAFSATVKTFIDDFEKNVRNVIASTLVGTNNEIKLTNTIAADQHLTIGFDDNAIFGPKI